jgi:hypothetical protein
MAARWHFLHLITIKWLSSFVGTAYCSDFFHPIRFTLALGTGDVPLIVLNFVSPFRFTLALGNGDVPVIVLNFVVPPLDLLSSWILAMYRLLF